MAVFEEREPFGSRPPNVLIVGGFAVLLGASNRSES